MLRGLDSARPITPNQAKQLAGSGFAYAARYLVPESYAWKRLIRAEAEGLTAAGLKIVSAFETGAGRPAGGAAAGKVDGAAAFQEALEICQPAGSGIYFAVDYNALPADYTAIEAYLRAVKAAIPGYRVGLYGSYAVIEAMYSVGAADLYWQTYAWSGSKRSAHAALYQYKNGVQLDGMTIDYDEATGDIGAWDTNGEEDEDMLQLSKYQRDTLVAGLKKLLEKGTINDPTWVTKAQNGTLTMSELAWLNFILASQ